MIQLLTLSIKSKTNIQIKTTEQFSDIFYPSKITKNAAYFTTSACFQYIFPNVIFCNDTGGLIQVFYFFKSKC